MKKIILISIIFCFTKLAFPQQDIRQYNYFLLDDYYMNPAYVGANDFYTVNVAQDIWYTGMGDASPRTSLFTVHSRVGKGYLMEKDGKINKFFSKFGNMALGMQNLYFDFGPQWEYNLGLTYGHYLKLRPDVKTKRPRQLVLAFTPRFIITGFNRNRMTTNDDLVISSDFDYLIPPQNQAMMKANFMLDVGGLYQSVHTDIGFTALNLTNTHFGYDSDTILYGRGFNLVERQEDIETENGFETITVFDTIAKTPYGIYDSIYSPRLVLNAKLKFLNIVDQSNLEINFVPKIAFMYAPISRNMEFFFDGGMSFRFYESVTAIRRILKYEIITGVYVNHKRNFKPYTLLQPYVSVDFMRYRIMYSYRMNANIDAQGYWGGNQISFVFNLARDKVSLKQSNNRYWKR